MNEAVLKFLPVNAAAMKSAIWFMSDLSALAASSWFEGKKRKTNWKYQKSSKLY